jgi:hypothetical protein
MKQLLASSFHADVLELQLNTQSGVMNLVGEGGVDIYIFVHIIE